jgi:hypothetical protein
VSGQGFRVSYGVLSCEVYGAHIDSARLAQSADKPFGKGQIEQFGAFPPAAIAAVLSSRASQRLLIPAPAFPGRGRRGVGILAARQPGSRPTAGPPLRPRGNPLGVAGGVVTLDDEDGRALAARLI